MQCNPLETFFYPYVYRKNWKYAYRLANGKWLVVDYVSLPDVFRMCKHCAKVGIPFRCKHRGDFLVGTRIATILNLFSNKLSDRFGFDTEVTAEETDT